MGHACPVVRAGCHPSQNIQSSTCFCIGPQYVATHHHTGTFLVVIRWPLDGKGCALNFKISHPSGYRPVIGEGYTLPSQLVARARKTLRVSTTATSRTTRGSVTPSNYALTPGYVELLYSYLAGMNGVAYTMHNMLCRSVRIEERSTAYSRSSGSSPRRYLERVWR
jgi:hypothetical protein